MTNMPASNKTGSDERSQSTWVWLTPLGLLAVLVVLYFIWPAYQKFVRDAYDVLSGGDQRRIEQWVSGFGAWSYVIVIVLMLFQTILAFLPSVALMVVAVVSFGPIKGGLVAWGGLLLAASLGYVIGRSFSVVTVDHLIGSKTERKVESFIDNYGIWAIIAARISPVFSTDAVSIAGGLVKMNYVAFIGATAAGTLPLTILIAWLGEEIDRLKTGLVWISVASVAIFIAYVIYDRRRRKKET